MRRFFFTVYVVVVGIAFHRLILERPFLRSFVWLFVSPTETYGQYIYSCCEDSKRTSRFAAVSRWFRRLLSEGKEWFVVLCSPLPLTSRGDTVRPFF